MVRNNRFCQCIAVWRYSTVLESSSTCDIYLVCYFACVLLIEYVLIGKHCLQLHDYGIRGSVLKWVKGFLDNCHQSVIVNGSSSEPIPVSSGVPQRCVPGPLLFLIYINDLPINVKSKMRLFADDAALYLTNSTFFQSEILQRSWQPRTLES